MKKVIKKSSLLMALCMILISCGGSNNSTSQSSSNSIPTPNPSSSFSSSSKIEQSSSTSIVEEELAENFLVFDTFKRATDWDISNAESIYNNGLTLNNSDNKEIKLVKKHISLIKEKNYQFILEASGTGTVKVELLNGGKENIINGMPTTYNLTSDDKEFKFIFTSLENYENVHIVIL